MKTAVIVLALLAQDVAGLCLASSAKNVQEKAVAEPLSDFDLSCYETSDKGKSYKGLATTTDCGRVCQNWVTQKPHKIDIEPTPDNGLGNHNYCRNPDGSEEKPWCYTLDPNPDNAKQTCNVPACPSQKRNFVDEAEAIATAVGSHDCECAAQLYGATTTTADTTVSFVQGKVVHGKCECP